MSQDIVNSVDNLINELNGFGRYQILNLFLTSLTALLIGISTYNFVFVTGIPEYRCRVPICDDDIVVEYTPIWLPNAVPYDNEFPQLCKRYALRNDSGTFAKDANCSNELFNKNETIHCDFENLVFPDRHTTIVNDLNIFCEDHQWKLSLIGTFSSVGVVIGGPITGYISDRYGRKKILIVAVVFTSLFGVAKSFAESLEAYIVMDVLETINGNTIFSTAFIIGIELVGPAYRLTAATSYNVCMSLGEIILGTVAWYVNSWRTLLRVLYIPGLIAISYWWIIPESIRWLICMKKFDEIYIILGKMSKQNNRPLPENYKTFLKDEDSTNSDTNIKTVLKNRTICLRFINCCLIILANYIIFPGLSLSSVTLSGNKYINFIITSTVEIPGNILCAICLMRFSRRLTAGVSYFMTGIFCILLYFIDGKNYVGIIIYTCGKLMATIASHTMLIFITELFPTAVRQSLFNISAAVGGVGSMIAPQIPLLAFIWNPLPILTFGFFALLASILTALLPETYNKELPNTITDSEIIDKNITTEL
ncbi:organic cation transporter protein-like [Chrysoperla carnea]|uniref:organic cation transporter protein-like n=1 Tax=Chrysoperla carnea TaxID=189513 RepID=UPI001D05DD90|nr:organic cation transporter protein-like [Chrysoperla carnea]